MHVKRSELVTSSCQMLLFKCIYFHASVYTCLLLFSRPACRAKRHRNTLDRLPVCHRAKGQHKQQCMTWISSPYAHFYMYGHKPAGPWCTRGDARQHVRVISQHQHASKSEQQFYHIRFLEHPCYCTLTACVSHLTHTVCTRWQDANVLLLLSWVIPSCHMYTRSTATGILWDSKALRWNCCKVQISRLMFNVRINYCLTDEAQVLDLHFLLKMSISYTLSMDEDWKQAFVLLKF